MKRKLFVFLLAIAMVSMFAFVGCAPEEPAPDPDVDEPEEPAEPDEPVEGEHFSLDFTTFWPGEDFQVTEGHEAWAQEIKERVEAETAHTIDFNWHPGGALLGATEIYEGVADGAADLGTTCPNYTPGIFPVTEAFEQPGLENDNALVSSMVIQEAFDTIEEVQQEYEDVKVMHFWTTGPGDVMTQDPVHTIEDLAGMEIRAAGASDVPTLEALGATPTTMPMSESYLSLDQGIVSGILAPTDTQKGFMLAEVTSYITKTPFLYNVVFMKVMNLDTWDSFPAEVQEIFNEVNEKYVYEYGVLRTEHTLLGEEFAVDEFGHEIIELDADEEERWMDTVEDVPDQYIEELDAAGYPGQEIMEKVWELDQKWSDEYGDYFD